MARPIIFNSQQTANYQTSVTSTLAPTVVALAPAHATAAAQQNVDQSNQLAYMLMKGIITVDDVRAFKGV